MSDPELTFENVVAGAHHVTLGWLAEGIEIIREIEDNGALTVEVLAAWYTAIHQNAGLALNILVGLTGQE